MAAFAVQGAKAAIAPSRAVSASHACRSSRRIFESSFFVVETYQKILRVTKNAVLQTFCGTAYARTRSLAARARAGPWGLPPSRVLSKSAYRHHAQLSSGVGYDMGFDSSLTVRPTHPMTALPHEGGPMAPPEVAREGKEKA